MAARLKRIFRRTRFKDLAGDYEKLWAEAEAKAQEINRIPKNEPLSLQKVTLDAIEAYAKANEAMTRMIEVFSPVAAKVLRFKTKRNLEIARNQLERDILNDPALSILGRVDKEEMVASVSRTSLQFVEIIRQFTETTFIAVSETWRTTAGIQPQPALEDKLRELGGETLSKMYEGAVDSLGSGNPDGLRHCAISTRELLKQVIDKLGKGETRKEKLRSILESETEADFAESIAELDDQLNQLLSKGVHGYPNLPTVTFSLGVTEHLLLHLLTERETK